MAGEGGLRLFQLDGAEGRRVEGVDPLRAGREHEVEPVADRVDGLPSSKRNPYAQHLRGLGLSIEKVRGVSRDENNALIRLADAVAGFVRDVEELRSPEYQALFAAATQRGLLVELP